jgi:mannose-6-phosphate isomerase-like protein (cupin superfamily)
MPFYRWVDLSKDVDSGETLPAGMSRRGIVLGEMMPCMHEALPDLQPPAHSHPNAQLVIMLEGRMRLTIGDEQRVIGPEQFAYIPAGVKHGLESLDYVRLIDVFSPPRADIMQRLEQLGQ